jgi:hypothetical protein
MTARRLIACRYPTADSAVLSWERLSAHFAGERAAGIATMRCIGSSEVGETHMVVAAALSDEDVEVIGLAPWGDGERCEEDIPELIAERLYARAARNAAALARGGRSGTFTTRRPDGSRLLFDSAGGYGPERRLYG